MMNETKKAIIAGVGFSIIEYILEYVGTSTFIGIVLFVLCTVLYLTDHKKTFVVKLFISYLIGLIAIWGISMITSNLFGFPEHIGF